ncbi:hypothetical protein M5K25_012399 [Dendrobium thyrsiflorum]|uniref:CCHC-type domain-containing protein n=1 Tax=Dendrobium thyrsiflorum TaxID=117978 RepID=A0ABD0UWX7_DENTH
MGRRVAFPYLISELKRNIIGMEKWSPISSPNSLHGLHSPIWIRFPQLPLIYWDTNNITRLANMLGEPLWMDSHTSSWGRSSYARICVRIDLSQKLQAGVWINGLHGRFFQRVEYEGLTNFCFDCGLIGHANGACLSKVPNRGRQSSPVHSTPPTKVQATTENASQEPTPPLEPKHNTVEEPFLSKDKEDSSLGAWNIVTRRRKGKPRAPKEQGTRPQAEPPILFSAEKLQQMEETSNKIVNFRKQQPRVSKSRLVRDLIRLGPLSSLATSPRKRKKTSTDFTSGDLVPSMLNE